MTRNLKTIMQFALDTPFTEPQVRWWIFNEHSNGLASHGAILRVGRRVYIDVAAFDCWIDSQQQVAA